MHIRQYAPGDERAVIALWTALFADTAPHNDPATAVRNKVAAGDGLFFVAEANAEVVGTVMGGYDGHRGWVYSVAVDPAHAGTASGRP